MSLKLKNEKGQSMVEFAIIFPILILILVGIIEFGFMFSGYLTLTNASRETARSISLGANDASAIQRANDSIVNLDQTHLIVTISPVESLRAQGDLVTVTLTYNYEFLTPFMEAILGNHFQLITDTTMRVE